MSLYSAHDDLDWLFLPDGQFLYPLIVDENPSGENCSNQWGKVNVSTHGEKTQF